MSDIKASPSEFNPRDPRHRWKLWKKVDSRSGGFHHVYWGRVGIALAALCVAGWLALAAGAWALVKYRRGIAEVRYMDLAFPWRWSAYRASMGAHYLAVGKDALEHGSPVTAINYLNASLSLAPGSLDSRRNLALAQFRLGLKPAALATLRAEVGRAADASDIEYVRLFFSVAFELQEDDIAYSIGTKLLPEHTDNTRIHRFIALQVATARYYRGHYFEAEEILADWHLLTIPEGEILFAWCDAERGLPDQAVLRLERALGRFNDQAGITMALEGFAREHGLPKVVYRYAFMRKLADPSLPGPRIDLLYAEHALGSPAEEKREFESYCADFKANANALAQLVQFAAETGQPEAAERARSLAQAGGFPTVVFDLGVALASIRTGEYPRALRAIARAQSDKRPLNRTAEAAFTGLKTVALFGAGDGGAKLAFADLLPLSNSLRPADGLFVVIELRRIGFGEQSRELLELLCTANPDDQPALAELVRLDSRAGNRTGLVASLPHLLRTRKPPRDALDAALPSLSPAKDATLIAQIGAILERSPVALAKK